MNAFFRIGAATLFVLAAVIAATVTAQEKDTTPVLRCRVSGGYASYEAGEVVDGLTIKGLVDHKWIQSAECGAGLELDCGGRARLYLNMECITSFSFYQVGVGENIDTYRETQMPRFSCDPRRAEGVVSLIGDFDKPALQLGIGYFPLKYNPEVRNLGEYLFRSTPYPQVLYNYFDLPYQRLLGVRLSSTLPMGSAAILHQDLLLTSEVFFYPIGDFSPSYVADVEINRLFNIGAGVCFYRLLPLKQSVTQPTSDENMFIEGADTGHYSFAGTKVMAHFTFDPKGLFEGHGKYFGKEDGKIYGEACMLGVENQGAYYDNPLERMPVMLGFNFPTFKVLDLVAIELEYWYSRYPNSYEQVWSNDMPLPQTEEFTNHHTPLKWSIYAKKEVVKNFSLILQVAQDHLIPLTHATSQYQDWADVLPCAPFWWWQAKAIVNF